MKQRIDFTEPVRHSSSVRPFAMQAGWEILTGNRRVLLVIESEKFGLLCMLIVGIGIDSIEMNVEEGDNIVIGSDGGCFHMGGSAILVDAKYFPQIPDVFTAGYNHKIKIRNDIICSSICQFEFKIKLWENLGNQKFSIYDSKYLMVKKKYVKGQALVRLSKDSSYIYFLIFKENFNLLHHNTIKTRFISFI